MKKITVLLICALICLNTFGCAPLVVGALAGGLGAYAVSKDTIQGDVDKSFDRVYNAVYKVAGYKGEIMTEDSLRGQLKMVNGANVIEIRLSRMTRSTTRIRVSCRKHHLPNLDMAQEIYLKIMEELQ